MTDARTIAATVGDLPSLPQVASKVIELLREPGATAEQLARVIDKDQALTARVLRMAHCGPDEAPHDVSTVVRAIELIGVDALRAAVLTETTEALHVGGGPSFKDRILWEHSLAVALAARAIAEKCDHPAPEGAYLGGLLHDIGKVVMDVNLPHEYPAVVERVYNEGLTFLEAEREVFGFDHAEVGGLVVENWNLAPALLDAVRFHHRPMEAETDPTLCAVVSLANSLCVKIGIGPERNPLVDLSGLESTLMLTLEPDRLTAVAAGVQNELGLEKSRLRLP